MILAFWQWGRIPGPRSNFLKGLGVLIMVALLVEIYGGITNRLSINNNLVYGLFGQLEALLVLWLIGTLRPSWKRWLLLCGMLFIGSYIINVIVRGTIHGLMIETVLLNALVLSILLICVLLWLAQQASVPLYRLPGFWIMLGLLIYFAGIAPTIGGYEMIFRDPAIGHYVYHVVQVLCIIRYLLAAYGCHLACKTGTWMIPIE